MKYKVKATLLSDKLSAFYEVLTNGTVQNQNPDGAEIVAAMKAAKITSPNVIEWNQTCFCATPLEHERATVYDKYITNITTELVDEFVDIEGDAFWDYLE